MTVHDGGTVQPNVVGFADLDWGVLFGVIDSSTWHTCWRRFGRVKTVRRHVQTGGVRRLQAYRHLTRRGELLRIPMMPPT